jgi:hypothetical protein
MLKYNKHEIYMNRFYSYELPVTLKSIQLWHTCMPDAPNGNKQECSTLLDMPWKCTGKCTFAKGLYWMRSTLILTCPSKTLTNFFTDMVDNITTWTQNCFINAMCRIPLEISLITDTRPISWLSIATMFSLHVTLYYKKPLNPLNLIISLKLTSKYNLYFF